MNSRIALLLPVIAGACWGAAGLFVRPFAEAGFDNTTIIFSKAFIGIPVTTLIILIYDRKLFRVKLKDLPFLAGVGFCGILLLSYAYNFSVTHLSLSLASILLCMAPIFVLLFSAVLFHEKITSRKLICMGAAFVGCAMLSGVFDPGSTMSWSCAGLLAGLISAVLNAMYTMLSKLATHRGYNAFTIYFYAFIFITIIIMPFTDFGVMVDFLMKSPVESSLFYLGHVLVSSMMPGIIYIFAVKYVEAGKVAILASGTEPVSAMIFGIIFYSEVPSVMGIAGMLITIAALIVLTGSKKKQDSE